MRLLLFYRVQLMEVIPIFEKHVPPAAVAYCYTLWQHHSFTLQVTRPRHTKLGDFRAELRRDQQPGFSYTITVNNNLNPSAFLITYLHEVAHLLVHQRVRRMGRPHGPAWQKAFREVMQPVLNETVFPQSILVPLSHYLQRPAASTGAHPALTKALRQLDAPPAGHHLLVDMPEGSPFRFLEKEYIRGMKRRTRIVCTEKATGLNVSVWAHVWVEKV